MYQLNAIALFKNIMFDDSKNPAKMQPFGVIWAISQGLW